MKPRSRTRGYTADGWRCARCFSEHAAACAFAAGALLGVHSLAGCAAPGAAAPVLPIVATPIKPAPPASPEPLVSDVAPALDATLIERVPEGTFGPYLGTAPDGRAVAVWAARGESDGARWFSTVLDARGAPLAAPRSLAEAPSELSLASVAGTAQGFVVLATGVTPTGTRVEALQLGPAGELANGPTPLVYSRTEVLWVKALQVGSVNVALWATLALGAADVQLVPLTPSGAQRAVPVRVIEGAKAWQAVEYGDGIALAALLAGNDEASRTLTVTFVDTDGHLLGQTEIEGDARLGDQLDLARVGDNVVVSWTRREGAEERLYLAAIGADARLLARPEPATAVFGRQRLLAIVPAQDLRGDALLVWEQVGQAPRGQQRIHVAHLDERGKAAPARAALSFSGNSGEELELARRGRGLAALTRAAACAPDAANCTSSEPVPTFVELDGDLRVIATEPLRLAPEAGKVADLAWGLRCSADACSALGAVPAAPVPIYGIELRARSRAWAAAAFAIEPTLPRALDLRSVADPEPLADLAAARVSGGWLVASLTQFDDSTPYVRRKTPAPDGRLAPVRALLGVQTFSNEGRSDGRKIISYRARAASGIALARLSDERTLLAWTALERERPEVFATLLGKNGAPVGQRMLTSNAGDVTSLAVAPLAGGSVVAWIAGRDGEARVFAARLNEALVRTAPEQRLSAAGGFTGLSLMRRGEEAWLAASRRGEREEVLSVTRLDPKTAARRGLELAIARSETSTFSSPVLVPSGKGARLAWVERPLVGGEDVARAVLIELDGEARGVGEPVSVLVQTSDPSAVRLYCNGNQCQGVIDSRTPDGAVIEGFDWKPGVVPEARVLAYRARAAADLPALALTDAALFYADQSEQRGSLSRAAVSWR